MPFTIIESSFGFKKIFIAYQNKVYQYALKKTNSHFQADEIVQLTFIKLWENRNHLKQDIPLVNQIFQITKSIIIDLYRKNQSIEKLKNKIAQLNPSYQFNTYDWIYKKELDTQVHHLISQMPPKRALIFKLSRIDELSYKEIALKLEISIKTVENQISFALKNLKGKI